MELRYWWEHDNVENKNKLCAIKGNVMYYFKPGEQMRMMYYSVMTRANFLSLRINATHRHSNPSSMQNVSRMNLV